METPKKIMVARLGAMMFLQFFIWGAWYATLGLVMAKSGLSPVIGDAYSTGPIASILASFLMGMLVDRFFASHKVLGVLHLIGAALLCVLPQLLQHEMPTAFLAGLLAYMVCYMPTLALTNNVAFFTLGNDTSGFTTVRVFGSIGWILAGLLIGRLGVSDSAAVFYVAAIAAAILGLYSFFLPKTPPPAVGRPFALRDVLCIDALKLLRQRHFLVFIISAMLISVPLATFYAYGAAFVGALGFHDVGAVMSLGQVVEVVFMLLIPLFYRLIGLKAMLLLSMIAWVLRYLLFVGAAVAGYHWLVYPAILLHGLCYDFFFVVAFIYTDKIADVRVKGQAQGLTSLFTYGFGMLIGAQVSGAVFARVTTQGSVLSQWQHFWLYPAAAAAMIAVGFQLLFHYRDRNEQLSQRNQVEVNA